MKWELTSGISESFGPTKAFTKSFWIDKEKHIIASVEAPTEDEAISYAKAICSMQNGMTESDLLNRLAEMRVALLVEQDMKIIAQKALQQELLNKHNQRRDY